MPWNLDPRVRSAMISDSLDVLGVRNNAMDVRVSALRPGMRAVGLAATVKFVAVLPILLQALRMHPGLPVAGQ